MKRLLAAVILVAFAIGGFGCKSANSSVSEDDVQDKQDQIEEATKDLLGGDIPEDEKRG